MAPAVVALLLSGCASAGAPTATPPRPGEISADPRVEASLVREAAAIEIREWRFGPAKEHLERVLAVTPADPIAHLYLGDLYRLEAQHAARPEDAAELLDRARQAYERAAALGPGYGEPYRQLGLLYYQRKDVDRAKAAFRRYLAVKPDAPDAGRIQEYLIELDR